MNRRDLVAAARERRKIACQRRRLARNVRDTLGRNAQQMLRVARRKARARWIEDDQIGLALVFREKLLDLGRANFDSRACAGIRFKVAGRRWVRLDRQHTRKALRERQGKKPHTREEIERELAFFIVRYYACEIVREEPVHLEKRKVAHAIRVCAALILDKTPSVELHPVATGIVE